MQRIIILVCCAWFLTPVIADELPTVADGYTTEKVAGDPLVRHPMMANFDDRGRLFIAESAGENLRADDLLKETPNFIRMLEDQDGDGVFDKSTIFADKMTLPQGALWYRGALYVAAPPNIWRLEDTDDDGVADKRDILVDKFGFNGNAASIHGPFLGPTGRIYWCDGRHGHEFKDKDGKVTSKGKAARIFSCRPDGTDVRTWCGGGMDNPVEVDFTPEGEMIGSVNLFYGRPRGDCLVHWVEGGVYPRRDQPACIDEFVRTGELMTEIKNFGHVTVSGMLRRRAVENDELEIITTIFNTGKLVRSRIARSGSTFTSVEDELMSSTAEDFHPTDVVEDADGSLLVIDTGGWFRIGCPTSQIAKPEVAGGIYRIRKKRSSRVEDPRGLKIAFEDQTEDQLVSLLDDQRFSVRERAIDVLAQRGLKAVEPLRIVLSYAGEASVRKRRNAVWAASRIHRGAALGLIRSAIDDDSPSVRLAAFRATSENNRRT